MLQQSQKQMHIHTQIINYSALRKGAEYGDEHLCLSAWIYQETYDRIPSNFLRMLPVAQSSSGCTALYYIHQVLLMTCFPIHVSPWPCLHFTHSTSGNTSLLGSIPDAEAWRRCEGVAHLLVLVSFVILLL